MTVAIVMGGSAILFVLIVAAGFLTSCDFLARQPLEQLQELFASCPVVGG